METRAAEIGGVAGLGRPNVFRPIAAAFERQRGHLFPWAAICLGTGIAFYFALSFEPNVLDMAILGAVAVLLMATAIWSATALSPLIWAVSLLLFGLSLASWRAHYVDSPTISFRYYGPVEGRIIKIDRSSSGKVRLTLDEVRLDRMGPARTPHLVRISLHGDQPFLVAPKPGLRVAMTGHLSGPSGPVEPGGFDFQRRAWFERLGAVGYTRSPALRLAPAELTSFALHLYQMRLNLSQAIKVSMPGREGPFAAAIITGERADIDAEALADLRGANLAHLLAISGLHMGLLTGALLGMMRVALACSPVTIWRVSPKKIAAVAALFGATIYLGISGASVATQRAYVMAGVMLLAICLDRRALTLRAVAVAAIVVLLIRPESIVGPGFQMSFAATIALVAVFAALRDTDLMYRLPKWSRGFAMLVLSSGVAGLATAPFGAAHFNQMAQYGLIANLISVPVMGLIVMPGAIIAALLSFIGLEAIGLEIMRWGLAWILGVADVVTAQQGAVRLIPAPPEVVLPLISIAGAALCLWQGVGRLIGLIPLAAAFWIWYHAERPPVLISQTGALIGVMGPEGRALNKPKGDGFASGSWLENDGDGADQARAAARPGVPKKQGVIRLGRHVIAYNLNKTIGSNELRGMCQKADLVIAPQQVEVPCDAISKDSLRDSGSLAIWETDGALQLDTTNARRGSRIWTKN